MNFKKRETRKMKKIFVILLVLGFATFSCTRFSTKQTIDPNPTQTKDLVIPASFNFETSTDISVGIHVKNGDSNLSGVPVSIYLDYPGTNELPVSGARNLGTYLSHADGMIDITVKLPSFQDSLYLKTNYVGLESEAGFKINGATATYTYGEGNTLKVASVTLQKKAGFVYTYMGKFTTSGVPSYLEPVNDKITQGLLDSINASLPEKVHLPITHPQYIKSGNVADLVLTQLSDVWVTFVSEGAALTNAVGYYTYPVSTPPQKLADITKYTVIFPNASLSGSGGAMTSGMKVKLGRFSAGTVIGWFLAQSGWNGNTDYNPPTFYSEPVLNPETDPAKRQHTVLLYDNLRSLLLIGFEDQIRNTPVSSDEDFNDVLFYVTSNPVNGVDLTNVSSIDTPADNDKDGVSNMFDEFPNDPLRAYTNYYPSIFDYTSLLVEDLWPSLGDFDFNDLVVDCQYKNVLNAQTNIVEMYVKVKVRAIGAGFNNGFGIQLPVASSVVSSVTLTDQAGVVKNIGVESGQTLATVIAFNDAYTVLPSMGGGTGVNVISGVPYRTPVDLILHILFTTPQTPAALGTAPFNPFIFVNGDRTKEIHMANAKPTVKASSAFFGQADDGSNVATATYYKSKNNLVWMIEVPSSFSYDIETKDITKAYLHFGAWAQSGGTLFKDWYLDSPGYRDNTLIYK